MNYNDVEFNDIPSMVLSGCSYCACKLKDEYRLDDNFEGKVDVLIIDVDETCNIDQAKQLFGKYKFYIITTRTHQKEKHGLVCDRFRIFFELSETVDDRKMMEEIYTDFINTYPFIDTSCRNVSRFFYPSPKDAVVIKNDGIKYPAYVNEYYFRGETIEEPKKKVEEFVLPEPKNVKSFKCWLGTITQDIFKKEEMEAKNGRRVW